MPKTGKKSLAQGKKHNEGEELQSSQANSNMGDEAQPDTSLEPTCEANLQIEGRGTQKSLAEKGFKFQGRRVNLDHDYTPELLRKRREYAEAKTMLKERGIRFQTPFPDRLRVFYKDGTVIYNSVKEATADMAERGIPVMILKSPNSLLDQIHQLTW
ncbi:hypothetical protein SRHO_G00203400 [Serrasalmus rhombeus]